MGRESVCVARCDDGTAPQPVAAARNPSIAAPRSSSHGTIAAVLLSAIRSGAAKPPSIPRRCCRPISNPRRPFSSYGPSSPPPPPPPMRGSSRPPPPDGRDRATAAGRGASVPRSITATAAVAVGALARWWCWPTTAAATLQPLRRRNRYETDSDCLASSAHTNSSSEATRVCWRAKVALVPAAEAFGRGGAGVDGAAVAAKSQVVLSETASAFEEATRPRRPSGIVAEAR